MRQSPVAFESAVLSAPMWPASYTRRKEKLAAVCSVPAGMPETFHKVTGAALNSSLCAHSSARVQAWLPSQLQMKS